MENECSKFNRFAKILNLLEKINLVYIVGSGHCGSTLLDLLISSSSEVFSTGEISFYNIYKKNIIYNKSNPNYLCTCKKAFNDCPFWQKINQSADFKIKKQYSWLENLKISLFILFPFLFNILKKRKKYFEKKYIDQSYELLLTIKKAARQSKQKANIQYILDASKDPRRLFYLLNDDRIKVFPIFLVRDSRAVGYSYQKKERLKIGLKRKNFYITILFRWLMVNIFAEKLLQQVPDNQSIRLNYKQLCEQPKDTIQKLNKWLKINISTSDYIQEIAETNYHNIDGNDLRFKAIKAIKFNESWKKQLSPLQKKIAGLFLHPFHQIWLKK